MHVPRSTALLFAVFVFGCGSDKPGLTEPPAHEGLKIIAGDGAVDTVLASPPQAVVIELRSAERQPRPGLVVRFEALGDYYGNTPWLLVSRLDGTQFQSIVADTTSSEGRASVLVRFGTRAGKARLLVHIPELGLTDTATFDILPGAPAMIVASPKDTAVYAGNQLPLSAAVRDQFGNPRADPVAYSVVGGGVTVANRVATPQQIGRHRVVATAGDATDTTYISTPPVGTLALAYGASVITMNMDGSARQHIANVPQPVSMQWWPDGNSLLMDGVESAIRRVTLDGQSTILTGGTSYYPQLSPDGTRIYYSFLNGGLFEIRVMNVDGTGDALVHADDQFRHFVAPAPSSTGNRLVMVLAGGGWMDDLWQLDLGSGVAAPLGLGGHTPRWNASGSQLAFVSAPSRRIALLNASLGDFRELTTETFGYNLGLTWSPDGNWIAAQNQYAGRIELVNVQTGLVLPLAFTTGMSAPAWKP